MKIERYLTQNDAAMLCKLAENFLRLGGRDVIIGETILEILSASVILPEHVKKNDHVSLFSEVTFSSIDTRVAESLVLVGPDDANQALARVSVVSPIGLALIGRGVNSIVNISSGDIKFAIRITHVKSLITVDIGSAGSANMPLQ